MPLFDRAEIIGGKTKAFFERVKIRDLYDIANINGLLNEQKDMKETHKVILFYAALSASFPHGFTGRERRFESLQREFDEQLIPMLRLQEEKPTLENLLIEARAYINNYVLSQTEEEEEFLASFAK